MTLPIEILAFIFTYLIPLDLFHLSICSKHFYSIVYQNKKFKRRFEHSKKLVCGVSFHVQFRYELERFSTTLTFVLSNFFTNDIEFYLKKKLSSVIFNILTFRIYSHLFFCDRGISRQFSSCGLCCKVVTSDIQISNIMNSRLKFERFLFPDEFSKDFLGDYMFLSFHYYQGLKAKRFDEIFGRYPGLYQEFIRSPFFCIRGT